MWLCKFCANAPQPIPSPQNTVDGRNPFRPTLKPQETLVSWLPGNRIIPGSLKGGAMAGFRSHQQWVFDSRRQALQVEAIDHHPSIIRLVDMDESSGNTIRLVLTSATSSPRIPVLGLGRRKRQGGGWHPVRMSGTLS